MKKYLPQIGASLIAVALVLTYMRETNYALLVLLIVGVIDLFLEIKFKDLPTISRWIHKLFPETIDVAIMIGLLILTWWLFGGAVGFLPVCLGVIIGHLFWNENQSD